MPLSFYGDLGKKVKDLFKDGNAKCNAVRYKSKTADGIKLDTSLAFPDGSNKGNKASVDFTKVKIDGIKSVKFEVSSDKTGSQSATIKLDAPIDTLSVKLASDKALNKDDGSITTSDYAAITAKYKFEDSLALDATIKSDYSLKANAVFGANGLSIGLPFKYKSGATLASLRPKDMTAEYNYNDKTFVTVTLNDRMELDGRLLLNSCDNLDMGLQYQSGKKQFGFAGKYKLDKNTTLAAKGASDGSFSYRLTHKIASPSLTLGYSSKYKFSKASGFGNSLKSTGMGLDLTFE